MPTFLSAGVYHGAMRQAAVQLPAQYLGVLLAASLTGGALTQNPGWNDGLDF